MTIMIRLVLTAGLILTLLSGCAGGKQMTQMQEELSTIEKQLIAVQSQNAKLSEDMETLKKSVSSLRDENRKTRADLIAELSSFREQASYLRNQLDDTGSRMSRLLQNVEGNPESQPGQDTLESPGQSSAQGSRAENIRPKDLYDAAYLDLARKNYNLALSGFQEYLKRFPQSELADNAQYWIGEIFYANKNFNRALEEFLKVESNYPKGRKVPAALLKAGYCLEELQSADRAKILYQKIVTAYPQSNESSLARERLK